MPSEDEKLRAEAGSANVDLFDQVFTFVVADALRTSERLGDRLPAPTGTDAKVVAAALYKAGLRNGAFNIEVLFDTLFSADVHDHAMVAVGRKYGPAGEAAYHNVFARLIEDTGR